MMRQWLVNLVGGIKSAIKRQKLFYFLLLLLVLLTSSFTILVNRQADELLKISGKNLAITRNVSDDQENEGVSATTDQTGQQSVNTNSSGKNSTKNQTSGSNSPSPGTSVPSGSSDSDTPTSGSDDTDSSAPETSSAVVAFYSDSQSDTDGEDAIHQNVVNAILNTSANPVFHAGDLLEDGTQESLNRFSNVTNGLRSSRSFYAAQGNNERNSSVYFDNFSFPGNEHYYSVNTGNLHLVVLDNYATSVAVGSAQYNWLASDLQSADSQSRITGVMFHYPVYGIGGDTKGMAGTVVPLFQTYGVDFVISGHEHLYQKSVHDGITYLINSGMSSLGYVIAQVYNDSVGFSVYNNASGSVDSFSITKR